MTKLKPGPFLRISSESTDDLVASGHHAFIQTAWLTVDMGRHGHMILYSLAPCSMVLCITQNAHTVSVICMTEMLHEPYLLIVVVQPVVQLQGPS